MSTCDYPLIRAGLCAVLGAEPEFLLVGEATTGDEARRLGEDLRPDVLLLG